MAAEHDHHHHHDDHHHHGEACAHAAHQSERAAGALAQAEAACRAQGVRLTPIRRQVLEALYATHKPLGAYDLVALLASREEARSRDGRSQGTRSQEAKSRPLAPVTIYRALDFLMEQGLAHRLASRNAFVACPHGHGPGDLVAFLICEDAAAWTSAPPRPCPRPWRAARRERFQAQRQVWRSPAAAAIAGNGRPMSPPRPGDGGLARRPRHASVIPPARLAARATLS
jgi:Fe2+ or Zn2+ uptake regulation protein